MTTRKDKTHGVGIQEKHFHPRYLGHHPRDVRLDCFEDVHLARVTFVGAVVKVSVDSYLLSTGKQVSGLGHGLARHGDWEPHG